VLGAMLLRLLGYKNVMSALMRRTVQREL
jgi:hypothetical protein